MIAADHVDERGSGSGRYKGVSGACRHHTSQQVPRECLDGRRLGQEKVGHTPDIAPARRSVHRGLKHRTSRGRPPGAEPPNASPRAVRAVGGSEPAAVQDHDPGGLLRVEETFGKIAAARDHPHIRRVGRGRDEGNDPRIIQVAQEPDRSLDSIHDVPQLWLFPSRLFTYQKGRFSTTAIAADGRKESLRRQRADPPSLGTLRVRLSLCALFY